MTEKKEDAKQEKRETAKNAEGDEVEVSPEQKESAELAERLAEAERKAEEAKLESAGQGGVALDAEATELRIAELEDQAEKAKESTTAGLLRKKL